MRLRASFLIAILLLAQGERTLGRRLNKGESRPSNNGEAQKEVNDYPLSSYTSNIRGEAEVAVNVVCGSILCDVGEYCCNKSCEICAPEGGVCILEFCKNKDTESTPNLESESSSNPESDSPSDPSSDAPSNSLTESEVIVDICGSILCDVGEYCCNTSCEICAPVGGSCILEFCNINDSDSTPTPELGSLSNQDSDSPSDQSTEAPSDSFTTIEVGVVCGTILCDVGEFCCNESCEICAPEGGSCILEFCNSNDSDVTPTPDSDSPSDQTTEAPSDSFTKVEVVVVVCGTILCDVGEFCCNESCEICAPEGGSCILEFCNSKDPDETPDQASDLPSNSDPTTEPLVGTDSDRGDSLLTGKNSLYYMPDETSPHAGTWLQWPHHYQYGRLYRNGLDRTWISMTSELITSENVYIVAYNQRHKTRIENLLARYKVPMKIGNNTINFFIYRNDDVWVRDNGPIFVHDTSTDERTIIDFGFNGWGGKNDYSDSDTIPTEIGEAVSVPVVDLNKQIIVEGGAFEIDGRGTFMATRSSILNDNRNPDMTQEIAEQYFERFIGVTNFIWLDGVAGLEITDMHIDGFARFGNPSTIVTMNRTDLLYWEVPTKDINTLYSATDIDGEPYTFVYIPLTKNDVRTVYGKNLRYKGSYVNFYTGNTVVLVPTYNDPNDNVAIRILQELYPKHRVVGIDVRNLYENGGMVHCVTQQQPI